MQFAMVLNKQDMQVIVLHEDGFILPVSSELSQIIEKCKYIFVFHKKFRV